MSGLENTRTTSDEYFENERRDVLSLLPSGLGRALDVGCGAGATAGWLRANGAQVVHGIELVREAAEQAEQVMDRVWTGPVDEHLADLDGPYDAVLCLDVLEHLPDPYATLAALRREMADDGWLLVSLPNARNARLAYDLMFRGTFGYTNLGHRDWTHLRWFTRQDAITAIEAAGFSVKQVSSPPSTSALRAKVRSVRMVQELTNVQWWFLAQAK